MALPELLTTRVEQQLTVYCARRVPLDVRHLVRLSFKVRANLVTLFEDRVADVLADEWYSTPIAQFRFDPDSAVWTLHCCDQKGCWFVYKHAETARDIGALLHAVELDITRIFWG